jgi:hypothetical protein
MSNQTTATISLETPKEQPGLQLNWNWLALWGFLTVFAVFEVAKHGFVNGSPIYAVALTATAIGSFIAPDLTFLVGAGDSMEKGSISPKAVPFYNAAHRMTLAFALTIAIGIGLAPLASLPLAFFIGGLSWMAHIAMDRAAGYGLRNPDGSRDKH